MVATADETVTPKFTDPVDKVSSRVQAAAVFYPPTDFINFGGPNTTETINQAALVFTGVAAAFDFTISRILSRKRLTLDLAAIASAVERSGLKP